MPKTSKNSFQNVCLSACSRVASLQLREKESARWRISFQEIFGITVHHSICPSFVGTLDMIGNGYGRERQVSWEPSLRHMGRKLGLYPDGVAATVTGRATSAGRTNSAGQTYTASRRE